jgi:tryptophan 2,3-dioxygenase
MAEIDSTGTTSEVLDYDSYLKIPALKGLQQRRSKEHDEHLFIIIHQVYELWFKEVDFELSSVLDIMKDLRGIESNMLVIISRLQRVTVIMQILVDQIKVLETMTPLDFLDFRHELGTGTGFQSSQFHLIEAKLGLREEDRVDHGKEYKEQFKRHHQSYIRELTEAEKSGSTLFDHVQLWLENCFDDTLWKMYCNGVEMFVKEEEKRATQEEQLAKIKELKSTFHDFVHESSYTAAKRFRLSHKAAKGAIGIIQNRDEPRFHTSSQVLSLLMDVDSLLMHWRNNHSLFVHRMIGSKIGTGGSGGYEYLRKTVESDSYRIYADLFKFSSFIIPRRCMVN